ncbi:iron-containing alcohol dehydrogenase [Algiphilus sp.]|uniref:iron-containing alcohol dehydrogenase n=1 Tax=Algiphilus sp. TaxID=1872431 RepID=UPI0025C5C913|nr:iron-containing alcohol dehydrogenase [Algiphilus sp.]MCK5769025.1 iron-containing alcohol dehydrogenase [Algiphilus sp.]
MSKTYYEFYCPVKTIAGHKALEHVPYELSALGARRPMIITDAGVRKAGLLAPVEAAFAGAETAIPAVFDDVPPDSSLQTVRDAAALYRQHGCDAIIAIGGGSVIDTSKAVNILVSLGGDDLLQYSGAHNLPRPLNTLFVVPTTSGTGSEVTMVAVISDPEREVKIPFTSYFLMPDAAVLDPRMTLTLPPRITAMTGMDAMTHAVEAYTCMAANPISDAYATAAITRISGNLLTALDRPDDADARLELAQASTMAGIAFSNSMVGLVHALGHSLGAVCHLPHGLCMNLFLPYALEYNREVNGTRIGELLLPLAGADVYAATPADERTDRAIATIRSMRDALHERAGLPRTLQETGSVQRDQLDAIADRALDDGAIIFNPREADRAQLMAVLESAWG